MPKITTKTGARGAATNESKKEEKRSTYRVAPGQTITSRGEIDGEMRDLIYEPGEEIELTEAEAKQHAHAVVKGERRRSRDGQMSRMKAELARLERENEDLRARMNAKNDPEFENASESLKARGDNYIARHEPTPFGVPSDVLDAADRRLALDEAGIDAAEDDAPDTEEMSGGMKGLGREKGGSSSGARSGGPVSNPSVPSSPSPGQSVTPGTSDPKGSPSSGS